jgi:hypothetical protein
MRPFCPTHPSEQERAVDREWYQQQLTQPDVLEVRIRLGIVPETDHAQVLVELFDPITGVLQAQASIPHERLANWPTLLTWATDKAGIWLADRLEPF